MKKMREENKDENDDWEAYNDNEEEKRNKDEI